MSNLVIVAIPEENDRVWKVSSEKVPHMTLLFLGDSEQVTKLEQIILFVEHAVNTSLKRFYLPVDHRGELGQDQADVLFFKKSRYDFKAISDFRQLLLKDSNIKTAYDSATQFEAPDAVGLPGQPWIPHLTLGYPTAPAKTLPDDQGSSFYDVSFNKIAVWTGNSEGPEFLLKDYWEDFDEMTLPMDVAMSDLAHAAKVSDTPWSQFKTSDYTDEQYARACLLDRGKDAGTAKQRYGIPVREPDGTVNRNACHAAAAVLSSTGGTGSARGNKVEGSAEQIASAKQKLVALYKNALNEDVPEGLGGAVKQTADLEGEFFEHFGVKGMRWGQRKTETISVNGQTQQVTPRQAKRADEQWKKDFEAQKGFGFDDQKFTKEYNAKWENHDFSKEDWNNPSSTYQKYVDGYFESMSHEYTKQLTEHFGSSPTGRMRVEKTANSDEIKLVYNNDRIKHADSVLVTFKLKFNDKGLITGVEPKENSMTQTVDLGAEFLEHFGVKGMRWGVRKAAAGAKATSTFVKDVNFEARTARGPEGQSSKATHMVVRAAHKPFKNEDLPGIKARHGDYAKLINRAKKPLSKEAKAYRKDARETYIKRLETTANSMKNASGTRQYTIRERGVDLPAEGGALPKSKYFWEVSARDVKHAAGNVDVRLELIMADGYITDLKPVELENPMIHGVDLGEEFVLEHFGIKGMRWGVRNQRPVAAESQVDTGVFKRQTKIRTTGGEAHPAHVDAVRAAVQKQKLKKSGTDALSTQELRDLANRLQVENQVQILTSSKGKRFVNQQLQEETKNQVRRGAKKGVKKAAPHVIKKASKAAATGAVSVALL